MKRSTIKTPTWSFTSFSVIQRISAGLLGSDALTRQELSKKTGLGASVIHNALPIMRELQLISSEGFKRGRVRLTEEGITMSKGDASLTRTLGPRLVEHSPVLSYALRVMNSNKEIDSEALGHALATQFNKHWAHPASYRNIGRFSADILCGFGLVSRPSWKRKGRASYAEPNLRALQPSASADKLFSYLRRMRRDEDLLIVTKLDDAKKQWATLTKFKSLVDLGLVEPGGDRVFHLSEKGEMVRNALRQGAEARVLAPIILEYPPAREILTTLAGRHSTVSWREVGEEMARYNVSRWNEQTKKTSGIRFLSWLKAANIVQPNHEYGRYRLVLSEIGGGIAEKKVKPEILVQKELPLVKPDIGMLSHRTESTLTHLGLVHAYLVTLGRMFVENDPTWCDDMESRNELIGILNRLEQGIAVQPGYRHLILSIKRLTEKAYQLRDLEYLREAGLSAYDLERGLR